ncbi:hypothetical protein RJ639_029274 [Escallonia herrerae]|uniref:Uncharacterized protein n=1 Tax=Escallonia herrerae TaxID=1293975 RepID=A0AA88X6B9_9ASTE|nr:hypothetical protein RJ639_029274 [Escallonia herrerae]
MELQRWTWQQRNGSENMDPEDGLGDSTLSRKSFASEANRTCDRTVTEFMVLLILRHALPIIASGAENYSFSLLMLLLLRMSGIILPIYIILKVVTAIHHRRRQQVLPFSSLSPVWETSTSIIFAYSVTFWQATNVSLNLPDEEDSTTSLQHQPHIIHIQ